LNILEPSFTLFNNAKVYVTQTGTNKDIKIVKIFKLPLHYNAFHFNGRNVAPFTAKTKSNRHRQKSIGHYDTAITECTCFGRRLENGSVKFIKIRTAYY